MKVPTERLREMLAACEGVTPGPWTTASDMPSFAIAAGTYRVVQTPNQNNYRSFGPSQPWLGIPSPANAAHIANCDPDTIRSALSELLELREAVRKAWLIVDEVLIGPDPDEALASLIDVLKAASAPNPVDEVQP